MNKTEKINIPQQKMPEIPAMIRRHNFQEVPIGYNDEQAILEATRCLQCKKPTCIEGCPVNVNIPIFINQIREGKFLQAILKIRETNSLPAVCGRVCPQEIQCQKLCILSKKNNDPVSIGNLERFAADWANKHSNLPIPSITTKTNKKIAIVGSGPSGLTAAGDLIRMGHEVTIFEALHKPGGVLIYGIPEFRLPKNIVATEISILKQLGCKIECNIVIGQSLTIDELLTVEKFDAIYISVGAGLPIFLNIPGENLIGIYSANEYLTRINLMKAYLFPDYDTPIIKGKNVIVFGAGNVAMDCLRTAIRLGANNVKCVYRRTRKEMPARIEEIKHAEEEGTEFLFLYSPINFIDDNNNGWVSSVKLQEMVLSEPDSSNRPKPIPKPDYTKTLKCDLAIIAVGSGANPIITATTPKLEVNKRGYILVDNNGKTKNPKIWAGGDIVTGSATVISAAGAGRKAADSINRYLSWGW